jgi:hypothetical protein
VIDGAGFQITRNSDGEIIVSGQLSESMTPGTSDPIVIGTGDDATGLSVEVVVTGTSPIEENDTFQFLVQPDNRYFAFGVDEQLSDHSTITEFSFNDGESFTDVDTFVDRFNAIVGSGEDFHAVNMGGVPVVRTDNAGIPIQLVNASSASSGATAGNNIEAWALEVGQGLYVYDIPRGHLETTDTGPYNITTANDRIKIQVIADDTNTVEFSIPQGLGQSPEAVASYIHAGGIYAGDRYWRSYALQVTDEDHRVVIETVVDYQLATIQMVANFTNIETLRFAQETEILPPYKGVYRGFWDPRVSLPTAGSIAPEVPAACEADPASAQCASDSAYFDSIVGWFVAPSPGTWVDQYSVSVELFTEGVGEVAGRYTLYVYDRVSGLLVERIQDVTFNKNNSRYIGNVLNPGSEFGGVNGNNYLHWEDRPHYLQNDPNASDYEVRLPAETHRAEFAGAANGIPGDPIYSTELDRYVIGNPGLSTGVFAFQNPEAYDVNLLATPGFSSGAVIGQSIQLCQNRGDMLYVVDPPFGLRPQQVIDWHNGMLLSDLRQAINSSYGALYWSWLQVFDQFSGEYIWIPPSGYSLSVFARTANVSEQWFAPAGLQRGRLLTPIDVEYSPTLGERDALYGSGNSVNPIVNFTQDGITIWGQRTLQRVASALDRINVRMLLIYIKKNLTRALRPFVFEQNDDVTWAQVTAVCEGFLGDIAARRGLDDFRVVCDSTTNTPERRDRNELWVSCFLKPTRVAEFIVLNLVVLRSDASFSAEEVLTAGGVTTGA